MHVIDAYHDMICTKELPTVCELIEKDLKEIIKLNIHCIDLFSLIATNSTQLNFEALFTKDAFLY